MTDKRLNQLRDLEQEYLQMPPAVQQSDLVEINELRAELGLPLVDAKLNKLHEPNTKSDCNTTYPDSTGTDPCDSPSDEETENRSLQQNESSHAKASSAESSHVEAREIYNAYLKKTTELDAHIKYAEEICELTDGEGQTPVRPLATCGTDGGPLLCDVCHKPILLEGGEFNGVAADVAWQKKKGDWQAWVLGGMIVEIETNGTVRIYHGYPEYEGQSRNDCAAIANQREQERQAKFNSVPLASKRNLLLPFFETELPNQTAEERLDLVNQVLKTLFRYDPGIGINRPSREK